MNEEQLIADVLDPWLAGISTITDECEREYGFSVRFGRGRKDTARSDIVLRRNGLPLMVVEAKRPDVELAADECEQALSYARLLTPNMAPVCVVTNGKQTLILNTFTGEILSENTVPTLQWIDGLELKPTTDDIALQFRALQTLIGLSAENSAAFAANQINRASALHRTSANVNWPAFEPSLHVSRRAITQSIAGFLEEPASTWICAGEPGSGKTSELLRLANEKLHKGIPLYIPLDDTPSGILDYLAREFTWTFSTDRPAARLIRDLAEMCESNDRQLILLLDSGPSEITSGLRSEIEWLCDAASNLNGTIRVLLAVQPYDWAKMVRRGSNLSKIAIAGRASTLRRPELPDVWMPELRGDEWEEAVSKAAKHFNISGQPIGLTAELSRNPAFLRFLAIARRDGKFPAAVQDLNLIRDYLKWKSNTIDDQDAAYEGLIATAKAFAKITTEELTHGALRNNCIDRDVISASNEQLSAAFRCGLLVDRRDEHDRPLVGFRDAWLVNYVLSFHVERIDRLTAFEIRKRRESFRAHPLLNQAVGWAVSFLGEDKRAALVGDIEDRAHMYAVAWAHFQKMAPGLVPGVCPRVVLVPVVGSSDPWFELAWDDDGEPSVLWADLDENIHPRFAGLEAARRAGGSGSIRYQRDLFSKGDMVLSATKDFRRAIRDVPRRAFLRTSSALLTQETAWALAIGFSGKLGIGSQVRSGSVSTQDLQDGLDFFLAKAHFTEKQRPERSPLVIDPGRGPRFVSSLRSPDDLKRINAAARAALDRGERPVPRGSTTGATVPTRALREVLQALHIHDLTEVRPPFPLIACRELSNDLPEVVHRQAVSQEIETLFCAAVHEYRHLVEASFPGLASSFEHYSSGPLSVLLQMVPEPSQSPWKGLHLHPMYKPGSGPCDEVVVEFHPDRFTTASHLALCDRTRFVAGSRFGYSYHLNELLRPSGDPPFEERIECSPATQHTPLRHLIFRWLKEDLRAKAVDNAIDVAAVELRARLGERARS